VKLVEEGIFERKKLTSLRQTLGTKILETYIEAKVNLRSVTNIELT